MADDLDWSGGVPKAVWERIFAIGAPLIECEDEMTSQRAGEDVIQKLLEAIEEFGRKPSLVGILADFTDDSDEKKKLYLEAWKGSCDAEDVVTMSEVSSSLVDLFIEEGAHDAAKEWLRAYVDLNNLHREIREEDPEEWRRLSSLSDKL